MTEETDFFEELDAKRSAVDPEYAMYRRRSRLVGELIPIRKAFKLTQKEVAARMGVNRVQVAIIESTPSKVSMDMVFAYAEALGAKIVVQPPAAA